MNTDYNPWHCVSPGDNTPNVVNGIIEITKGSKGKYELDKEKRIIKIRPCFIFICYLSC